jgi:hypothetical protein
LRGFRAAAVIVEVMLIAAACGFSGRFVAPLIGVDPGVATLGLLLVASALLSVGLEIQRRRLARRLAELSPIEQNILRAQHPVFRQVGPSHRAGRLSTRHLVWIGIAWVNLPLIPILVGPIWAYQSFIGTGDDVVSNGIALVLGFALMWGWWSVSVGAWRSWALKRGADPDELQWRGEAANLLWRRGHFFEKTELGQIRTRLRRRNRPRS